MITVVGLGPLPATPLAIERVRDAVLVVGSRRHLRSVRAWLAPRPGFRTIELTGDLEPALDAMAGCDTGAVVLASGDPGFFGVVRALSERFGRRRLEVIPAVSSVAATFARAGLSWDDALVCSAHGRDPRPAVNACRAHPKVAVLTSPDFGPAELAAELANTNRTLVVAQHLGEPDESVVEGTAAQIAGRSWRDPNVVLVLDERNAVGPKGASQPPRLMPRRWALGEAAFEHRAGMITKAEVRALALARLGPGLGDLVWDVGAGSGSVGIECARFGAAVVCVEKDPKACATIERNADRHNVSVSVVSGFAPDALVGLPTPDAVFVGGAGPGLVETLKIAASRAIRSVVVALATIERVAPAAEVLSSEGLEVEGALVGASRLRPLGEGTRLDPTNPVFLVWGVRA